MINELNRVVAAIEADLDGDIDVAELARSVLTSEHHLRRMFSALAGMPISEYVRRRRMTVAAAAVIAGDTDLLTVAVRYGYGSTEAFGRAFRSVHGATPGEVRRDGGPLRSQQQLVFRLTVGGKTTMHARIVHKEAFRLAGHSRRVPLIHEGANPHIVEFVRSLDRADLDRLAGLSDQEPRGIVSVSDDIDPGRAEGTDLVYLHGVATSREVPGEYDVIEVPKRTWAVFSSSGPHPQVVQNVWRDVFTEWFPSNPWRSVAGPEILQAEVSPDWSTATCELWLPVEPA